MAAYGIVRVLIIAGLFLLGLFCIVMGFKSRPHKLKKEPITIRFSSRSIPHHLDAPAEVISSRGVGDLVGAVIWAAIGVLMVVLGIRSGDASYFVYTVPCTLAAGYNLNLSTRKLCLHQNAIEFRSLLKKRVFYLDEIDSIQSYNIVNSFNRGKSFGYAIMKDGKSVMQLGDGEYKNLPRLESFFHAGHPQVEEVAAF